MSMTARRTVLGAWLGLCAGALCAVLAPQVQAAPQEDGVQSALDRLGEHPPPPPFREDREGTRLLELQGELDDLRAPLLVPGNEITPEERATLADKLSAHFREVQELIDARRTWAAYQANPSGEWWRDAENTVPVLSAADSTPEAEPDFVGFCLLLKRFQVLEYFLAAPAHVGAVREGYEAPTAAAALAVAREFEPFEQGRIEVGGQGGYGGGVGSLQLRAGYLRAQALLMAAHMLLDDGRDAEARAAWEEAIDALHSVDRVFKLATHTGVRLDALERLAPIPAATLDDLRRSHPHGFIPLNWDNSTHRIGSPPGGLRAESTARDVRVALERACPWSPPVWKFLSDMGMTEGFELRVLREFELGILGRRVVDPGDPHKVWISNVGPAAIPPSVRRDLEKLRRGEFLEGGQERSVQWRTIQGTDGVTVWIVSPTVADMTPGEFLGWTSKAVTAASLGVVAIVADVAGEVLSKGFEHLAPDSASLQIMTGIGSEAVPWEFEWDPGQEGWDLKRQPANPVAMLKGALLSILNLVEKAEIEALFDGIDPDNGEIADALGGQTSYAGAWMPPIILRANLVGHERTTALEYDRLRIFTVYWALDPRGLTGHREAWDLSRLLVDDLPGAADYRAGGTGASERTWWRLPEAKTPDGWGRRLRTIAFQPMHQLLFLTVEPELEKSWREECPEGHDLAMVLRYPPPFEKRVDVVPLGERFAFSSKGLPSLQIPGGFLERKIFAVYDAHVIRAPQNNRGEFDIDSPNALELARFPVRFVSRDGQRVTGKVIVHDDRRLAELNYTFEGQTDRAFELEPEGSDRPILPPRLVSRFGQSSDQEPHQVRKYDDEYELCIALAPAEKGRAYRLEVQAEIPGRNWIQKYAAHGRCEYRSGAALFKAKIPVGVGRNRLTVSLPEAPPVVLVVDRADPEHDPVNVARYEENLRDAIQDINEARNARSRMQELRGYLVSKIYWAKDCAEAEQYNNARDLLHQVEREFPDWNAVKQVGEEDNFQGLNQFYVEVLQGVAFHQGDLETFCKTATEWLHLEVAEVQGRVASGSTSPDVYQSVIREYYEVIERCILLDGEPAIIEQLIGEWRQLRVRSGQSDPEGEANCFLRGGNR